MTYGIMGALLGRANSSYNKDSVGRKQGSECSGPTRYVGKRWEWCFDRYGTVSTGEETDPQGAGSGSFRVGRGGSWFYAADGCTVGGRGIGSAGDRVSNLGFRLACRP